MVEFKFMSVFFSNTLCIYKLCMPLTLPKNLSILLTHPVGTLLIKAEKEREKKTNIAWLCLHALQADALSRLGPKASLVMCAACMWVARTDTQGSW